MKILLCFFALCLACSATANEYDELVQSAFDAIHSDYYEDWAFTETSLEDDIEFVARFDPRRLPGERWQLLSVDARAPDAEEIASFLDEKEERRREREKNGDDEDNNSGSMINFDTLVLIEETNDYWLFRFVPNEDEEQDKDFMKHVTGHLRISKAGPYVEYLDLRNEKPIKPATGVKIRKFEIHISFGPAVDAGPIVVQGFDMSIEGRAMLVIKFDEHERIRYSDWEFAGDAGNGAG